jgi:hypothetical protein
MLLVVCSLGLQRFSVVVVNVCAAGLGLEMNFYKSFQQLTNAIIMRCIPVVPKIEYMVKHNTVYIVFVFKKICFYYIPSYMFRLLH